MLANHGIAIQVIDQVGPAAGAGRRSVDENDGYLIRTVGLKTDELRGRLPKEVAVKEPGEFALPYLGVAETVSERRADIRLKRHRLSVNLDSTRFKGWIDV